MKRQLILVALVALWSCLGPTSAQADPLPEKLTIATWNLEWFFDDYTGDNPSELARRMSAPSKEEWQWRVAGIAEAIAKMNPTIIALQEIESRRACYDLTKLLKEKHGLNYRIAFIEGWDFFTEQDVAILAKSGLVEYSFREQSKEMWDTQDYYNLQKHLFATFQWGHGDQQVRLTLLDLHLRAMPDGAPIRQRQARLIQQYIGDMLHRGENVIVLGDLNSEEKFADTAKDGEIGIARGLHDEDPANDLTDLHEFLKPADRQTHLLPEKEFDRILVSPSIVSRDPARSGLVFQSIANRKDVCIRGKIPDKDHWNIYFDIPQDERDLSDHYPLLAEFEIYGPKAE